MFHRILVPVDFTEKNRVAMNAVMELARAGASEVTLLHVIETMAYEDDEIKSFYATLEHKARSRLQELAEQFDDTEISITGEVVVGRRGDCIVHYVLANEIDLVVMSSHPIDVDQLSQNWATLSYQVSILCPCPVLLVK